MKKNEIDEQPLSVSSFALQLLAFREKKNKKKMDKKPMMKKNEKKNEIDEEEMEKIRAH